MKLAFEYSQEKDDILLMEDAVYAGVVSHSMSSLLLEADNLVFLLLEDVQARGLEGLVSPAYTLISYSGFVELTAENEKSMTW